MIEIKYKFVIHRDHIKELEKLLVTKTELINQQNMTLNLMREINPSTNIR